MKVVLKVAEKVQMMAALLVVQMAGMLVELKEMKKDRQSVGMLVDMTVDWKADMKE